jgi:DNA-binding NarL/FixJ family response regulator
MIDGKTPDESLLPSAPHDREISGAPRTQSNGHAGAARCVLYLDNLRLTRDCLTEVIREKCPDLHVMGLRPLDFDAQPTDDDIALIIVHLHDAPLSAVSRLAHRDPADAQRPPILVITDKDESAASLEAMQAAIEGLVRSDARIDLLLAAIRLVIAGGRYYPADRLTQRLRKAPLIRTPD